MDLKIGNRERRGAETKCKVAVTVRTALQWLETNRGMGASLNVAASLGFEEVLAMRRILILASSALFLPAIVLGQHRGGMPMHPPVAVAPPRAALPVQAAPAQVITSAPRMGTPVVARRGRIVTTPIQHAGTFVTLPTFPVDFANSPGLGFDFPHLAAINSGRTHVRFRGAFPGEFNGFNGFSGFLLSPPVIIQEAPPQEQPVIEEVVAANPNDVVRERARRAEREDTPDVNGGPPAPVPDSPEFVFVRRDGGLLFAVAYYWDNGTLRYVTRDGLRRSVTQDSLDMQATQQFNEQRGVNFRLPA
jgi:hypothetical protein